MNSTKEVEIVASIPGKESEKDPEAGSNSIDSRAKFSLQEQEQEQERKLEHGSSLSEKVEVVVERNLILAASIGDDFQLEVTADQINSHCATADTQTVDIEEPLDEETKQLRTTAKKISLYHAALKGDWEKAQSILGADPSWAVSNYITRDNETALHIAAGAKHVDFVEQLINIMTPDDMTMVNTHGNTALCFAATSGVVRIAELMVQKNKDLPLIRGFGNATPLFMAISYQRKQMASYLFSVTDRKQLSSQDQIELLIATIHSDFYDISLEILERNPKLAIMRDTKNNNETALHVLARKPSAISSRSEMSVWKKRINSWTRGIYEKEVMKTLAHQLVRSLWGHVLRELPEKKMLKFIKHPTILLHDAARAGNVEFLILLIRSYPNIAWEDDENGQNVFHVAVENRLENVFSLIHEISGLKDFSAKYRTTGQEKYNMLHLAAKLAAPNHLNRVSGAALQMQRELLWFKEVEKIVLPSQREAKCEFESLKLIPSELFTKEHKDLRKEGEEWMKNTANSCMLVSTLIATVVFAAAFTVPGGNDDKGTPVFQREFWFTIFVISDAFALVSSSTSILMFLSILTSRYAEDDFLHSLPSKLLFGIASLFISIVCMVIAFSATFFMLYDGTNVWIPTTVTAIAIVPISCFFALQFGLWMDTFYNTYLSRLLFKPHQRKLFSSSASLAVELFRELKKRRSERKYYRWEH
ncbi:ankyrin repeat-containing protein NPR4-like isoform X1 [Cucurbita pepo subsp. pepo]|uniref:ankyrin repeat-containing protein NPR4-like isoform X1 n=1 Tax=Cucurbita pepo subsp. pepo TaxID=3664 RepID=UPI000C9D30AE|nr:ankyrin repeat-containing protein NPR4-like isoform X1 [Cucurbita pepo subsp. pepo]